MNVTIYPKAIKVTIITVTESYRLSRSRIELIMGIRGYATWRELADATGIEPRKLSRWVTEFNTIKANDLAQLADALQVNSDYLIGRSEDHGIEVGDATLTTEELELLRAVRAGNRDDALAFMLRLFRDQNSTG